MRISPSFVEQQDQCKYIVISWSTKIAKFRLKTTDFNETSTKIGQIFLNLNEFHPNWRTLQPALGLILVVEFKLLNFNNFQTKLGQF
jgi:hypothetical protein